MYSDLLDYQLLMDHCFLGIVWSGNPSSHLRLVLSKLVIHHS